MDIVRIIRRLSFLVVLGVLSCVCGGKAYASTCASYDNALADAQTKVYSATHGGGWTSARYQAVYGATHATGFFQIYTTGSDGVEGKNGTSQGWSCPDGFDPVAPQLPTCGMAPFDIPSSNADPAVLQKATTTCSRSQPDPDTGDDMGCQMHSEPMGPYVQDADGLWHGHMHVSELGSMCKVSSDGTWKGTLGDGTPDGESTAEQSPPAPVTGPEPRICKTGSCYDPNTGNVSAVVDGQTKYLPNVPKIMAGSAPGNCFSDASSALCAGAPPPLPSNPPISDPPSQVKATDQYATISDDGTGRTITVSVYGGPGTSTTGSGQQAGDSGPASSGSTGGSSSSVVGGGDCKTPPACHGDAVQCAVLSQTYANRCASEAVQKAVQSTQDAPASGNHTVAEVDSGTIDLGDTSSLDGSGFGFGTACPFVPVEISIGPQMASIPMDKICEFGPWMRGFILMLAAMKCADILGKK